MAPVCTTAVLSPVLAPTAATQPTRIHPKNARYFRYFRVLRGNTHEAANYRSPGKLVDMLRCAFFLASASLAFGAVRFVPGPVAIETQDFAEVEVRSAASASNPFVSFALQGKLRMPDGKTLNVDGFADAADGSVHRIRFLAVRPGSYSYDLQFDNGSEKGTYRGTFTAKPSQRKGLLAVDPQHPFHFLWSGTGDRYFWNGLTTYALLGWKNDAYIGEIIDRAAAYKVNRLRVTLVGPRVEDASRWYEPVTPSDRFQFLFGPWPAAEPQNVRDPKWDVTRFDTAFFAKAERAIRKARERDVIISVIFFLDGADPGADPFGKAGMFGEDVRRYYRYVNARLAAYSNVTWDVTNEWHLFRNAWWVEVMGSYLKSIDPYKHLISTHGRGDFPWELSQWPDFALYQIWDEAGGYDPMLRRRSAQLATGHPFPQINEEYGYEDHYPAKWGGNRRPPGRSADNRRRLAWEITMAGCYQTTGEKANRNGDGKSPATPGGWVNGGFDESMSMLDGYKKMVEFFESIPYWKMEPLAPQSPIKPDAPRVLAERGVRYVVYLPAGGQHTVALAAGEYRARSYDPRTGLWSSPVTVAGEQWTTPAAPAGVDIVYLLEKLGV
jgi:hypothetical protein